MAQQRKGAAPGMENLLKEAEKMKRDLAKMQESLKDRIVEGKSSGDLVICMINGNREVVGMKIKPEAVDPDDPTILEDLVITATNNALKKIEELINKEQKKVTGGGMGIPGMM